MTTTKKITKAIFPVAGIGSRFLPATKANPKEMLPIVDKPLIQYAVEEAAAAGIQDLIFITSSSKRAIEDHFDSNSELEAKLASSGKDDLLALVRDVLPLGTRCAYVRQPEALGLGHAVLCAQPLIGDEPFAVLLADDLIDGNPQGCLKQMLSVYESTGSTGNVIAVQSVAPSHISQYGVVDFEKSFLEKEDGFFKITGIVEKPPAAEAPSSFGVVGRYILQPQIFDYLHQIQAGSGGEIQLTDAIAKLLKQQDIYALEFEGTRYDCGSKLGYLQATIAYALKHKEIASSFREHLLVIAKNL
jgi:UTP--glucose-1-phosphate uridylyltransferase